jgi:hypothetical protein
MSTTPSVRVPFLSHRRKYILLGEAGAYDYANRPPSLFTLHNPLNCRNSTDLPSPGSAPATSQLLTDISAYILDLKRRLPTTSIPTHSVPSTEPAIKKRKIDGGAPVQNGDGAKGVVGGALADLNSPLQWRAEATSFSMPARKKLTLEVVASRKGGVRAVREGVERAVEAAVPWTGVGES